MELGDPVTIPKRLWIFFRYGRKLLGEFAGCASRALKLLIRAYNTNVTGGCRL